MLWGGSFVRLRWCWLFRSHLAPICSVVVPSAWCSDPGCSLPFGRYPSVWCRLHHVGPWWFCPMGIALGERSLLWGWRWCLLVCRDCPCSICLGYSTRVNTLDASWRDGWMQCPWNLVLENLLASIRWGSTGSKDKEMVWICKYWSQRTGIDDRFDFDNEFI